MLAGGEEGAKVSLAGVAARENKLYKAVPSRCCEVFDGATVMVCGDTAGVNCWEFVTLGGRIQCKAVRIFTDIQYTLYLTLAVRIRFDYWMEHF